MDGGRHRERYEQGNDPGNDPARVLALSDGVAIVLTLLVLEIQVRPRRRAVARDRPAGGPSTRSSPS